MLLGRNIFAGEFFQKWRECFKVLLNKEIGLKILRAKGGLGNQVFQLIYLLTHSQSTELLLIDKSLFSKKFEQDYAGASFRASEVLTKQANSRFSFFNVWYPASGLFWKLANKLPIFKNNVIDDYCNRASLFSSNYKYKDLFDLNSTMVPAGVDQNAVLIHVRKGDYTNSVNSKIYYNCDVSFFKLAIAEIEKAVSHPKYFIMSNDDTWVRENFTFLSNYQIIDISDTVASFKVMCAFQNFIISNSTFSWWPAFLSGSKNVVAPKSWFLDEKLNIDLYPESWIKV